MSPTVSWGKLKPVFMKKNCRQPVEKLLSSPHIRLQQCSSAPSWLSGFLFPCRVKCNYVRVYLGLLRGEQWTGQRPQMLSIMWLGHCTGQEYWHYVVGKYVCIAVSIICWSLSFNWRKLETAQQEFMLTARQRLCFHFHARADTKFSLCRKQKGKHFPCHVVKRVQLCGSKGKTRKPAKV